MRFLALLMILAVACGSRADAPGTSPSSAAPVSAISVAAPSPPSTPTEAHAAPWTVLRWSQPVPIPDQGFIFQVVNWHDGYVAAGQATEGGRYVGATFVSPDGVRWQRTATFPLSPTLVATDTRLVAVVTIDRSDPSPTVDAWASSDGQTWQHQEALAIPGATIERLAARGSMIVGVGTDPSGRAALWRSTGGAAWTRAEPPSQHAIVRDFAAVSDGFIALGREGEPDVSSGGVGVPGVGRPAAWWSADGRVWSALQVEGAPATGAQLFQMFAVADGFFAVGSDTADPTVNPRSPLVWVSADARTWRLLGPPPYWGSAGANGQRAVYFAPATGSAGLGAWVSRDGRQWTPLSFVGDLADIPGLPGFAQGAKIDGVFVMPQGVIVIGQQSGHPLAWFADADPH